MKGVWIISSALLLTSPTLTEPRHRPDQSVKTEFGVRISPDEGTRLVGFSLITVRDGENVGHRHIDEQTFVMMATGKWPSRANRQKEDLFKKNGVEGCFELTNPSSGQHEGAMCAPCDSLWKVRFSEHPTKYEMMGWSDGLFMPNDAQQIYLHKEFGIYNVGRNYFQGDSLWKILRCVQDSTWILSYKNL